MLHHFSFSPIRHNLCLGKNNVCQLRVSAELWIFNGDFGNLRLPFHIRRRHLPGWRGFLYYVSIQSVIMIIYEMITYDNYNYNDDLDDDDDDL